MSLNPIVQYFNHALSLNGFVTATQSITVDQSASARPLVEYGKIRELKVIRPKPEVRVSVVRALSNNQSPLFTTQGGDLVTYYGIATGPDGTDAITYDIEFGINRDFPSNNIGKIQTGGSSLKFSKFLLSEARYNFNADSTFADEQLTFIGHTVETGAGAPNAGAGQDQGDVLRRHHFNKGGCSFPQELQSLFISGRAVLREVSVGFSFNWNQLTNFGEMNTNKFKYASVPIDISCSITVIDLGFDQSGSNGDIVSGQIMSDILFTASDFTPNRTISISAGGHTWDLGSKNYLASRSRRGGDAGSSGSYSTYTYEYKNSENFLIIS
jgi:hypothetical protein